MSHSSHSTANPVQGSTGAQQSAENNSTPNVATQAYTGYQEQPQPAQQPVAHSEADSSQTEELAVDDDWAKNMPNIGPQAASGDQIEDLERGVPCANASNVQGSDNTMNEEGGVAPSVINTGSPQPGDARMEESGAAGSSLPPIDDARRQQMEKAAQRAAGIAEMCARYKTMTLEQKKKELDAYVPSDFYKKGCFIDAQDTTNCFIMAKVVSESTFDINVNYDGWPERWNYAFKKKSYKVAPYRSVAQGYSGQNYVAIRNSIDEITLDDIRVHINHLEYYITNDFENKTSHQMTQYVRGHLFVFLDQLMGLTCQTADLNDDGQGSKHPFEYNEIQRLFRTYLRFVAAYFRKLTTLGKSISQLSQLPRLFLVDPQCATVNLFFEMAETLSSLFAAKPRTIKHYIQQDTDQLSAERIGELAKQNNEHIMANSFGTIVRDYSQIDFVSRAQKQVTDYNVEHTVLRVQQRHDIVFGSLLNLVQYFAEIGGFDALFTLLQMGTAPSTQQDAAVESSPSGAATSGDYSGVKMPFKIMNCFMQAFTHLENVFTVEFSKQFTTTVKQSLLSRLETMSERDLKDIDKDEIGTLINHLREFLTISVSREEAAEFVEHTNLIMALRFLKSENLEKRLKGLAEIRHMCERVVERARFENWSKKTGKTMSHYNARPDNKDKPYPSEAIKLAELKQWLISNNVLQIILGPTAHIEIIKRSGPLLKLLCRPNEVLFDESIVELVWRCQVGKHEEMVRTIYNLIQEVLPVLPMAMIDKFFEKVQAMPPVQIDEKYVVFLREFSNQALKKRFHQSHFEFQSKVQADSDIPFYESIRDKERANIAALNNETGSALINELEAQTHDYGLRFFWQIIQDSENGQAGILSGELQELVIASLLEIFNDCSVVKQVRSLYLIKAVNNILAFRSMHQSITIATAIIGSMQSDPEFSQLDQNEDKEISLVVNLQKQVILIDALVQSLVSYQEAVKQKCKQMYNNGGTLPDKIDEQVFLGRYAHKQTLQTILEFVDFMITQAQKDSNKFDMSLSLGIENIKRIWCMFVKQPNFQSDQTLFLDWINKQRNFRYTGYNQQYQKVQRQHELSIFSEKEKRFMFEHFLCNPEEVDAVSISPALVNVFQKYFQKINLAEQFLQQDRQIKNKYKVINFEALLGMEALWKMALYSMNDKAKDISQQLLVNVHLRWDNNSSVTQEKKKAIIENFVKHCMSILSRNSDSAQQISTGAAAAATVAQQPATDNEKKAVIQLMSLFTDRYEGIKELKPEQTSLARVANLKPIEIDVVSLMEQDNRQMVKIIISAFQTIGHLREKIAKEFKLAINEFNILIKNSIVDPDIDDDKYLKDVHQQLPKKFGIERNQLYEPTLHPKFLLAKNQENFSIIFSMLKASSPELCEPVWDLISKLPVNESFVESLKTLHFIKNVTQNASLNQSNEQAIVAAWKSILDPQAVFKLLYGLQIIQKQFINVSLPTRDEELYDDEDTNQEFNNAIIAYQQQRAWKDQFIKLGGFSHLLNCLSELNIQEISSSLELKVIQSLLKVIFKFVQHDRDMNNLKQQEQQNTLAASGATVASEQALDIASLLQTQQAQLRNDCVLKVICLVDAICKYSSQQEKLRGETIEEIQKKLENAKLRKQRQRAMVLGNKAEKAKQIEDDDDGDSEDKKQFLAIISAFKEQADILQHLFDFIDEVFNFDAEVPCVVMQYAALGDMLERGMIISENWFLRDNFCKRMRQILLLLHRQGTQQATLVSPGAAAAQPATNSSGFAFGKIVEVILSKLIETSKQPQFENRCNNLYQQLSELLVVLSPKDMEILHQKILFLIEQLPKDIIERSIKEIGSNDHDVLLGGLMGVLNQLLQRFPGFKKQVGQVLTNYLIHDCLFEIPHGSKNAPKCKGSSNRRQAFSLLQTLSTDCLENLLIVLDYMRRFNLNPSWRTNRSSDWNIKLQEDEKSTTGRVGIKNLGCICYMNSLNQQLFMIPGFRNDILSVDDPNHDKNPDEDNMFLQWQTLFAGLLLSQKMYVNPKSYCHAFKDWEGQPVNVFEQMDVEEYLTMFMDRLETAIKGTPQEKTIQFHFGGKFANEVICKTCPHVYTRDEAFLSLGVPVKNKKTLQEGMDAFIAGDLLEQDNQYHCEKCDKKVDALKRTCLMEMPRYMLTTLKRFDFDFDLMIRKKLNDYFEFQTEVDFKEYTQDYLNQKERQEKDREEAKKQSGGGAVEYDEEDDAFEIKMKQPAEYYQYDLVGIVVHTGTADSGHYYSYIKEQDELRLVEQETDKWYEFNDTYVRDFDHAEIPQETFGGEETAYANMGQMGGQQKIMRMRNAYVLVYKRKLTEDSLIVTDEDPGVAGAAEGNSVATVPGEAVAASTYKLGSQQLQLSADNRLNQKIQWDNHRYWHIRYLFRSDYRTFVNNILLYWNTQYMIPREVSWRNNDYHLLDPRFANLATIADKSAGLMEYEDPSDVSLNLKANSSDEQIQDAKVQVFKFAVQFYYTIQQRSQHRYGLPDMSRYLKAYINEDVRCARWFINEFINCELLKEIMMQNSQKLMRRVYIGIITCAMLKLYEEEKGLLNAYWDDLEKGVEIPRQTTLGNYINTLLYLLPQLVDFSANQAQFLQVINQFQRMGIEAKQFLIRGDTIQRLLNFFYFQNSPFRNNYITAPKLPGDLNERPDMDMPTPEDPNEKKSTLAIINERERLAKLMTDTPVYMHLIEAISNLIRCSHIDVPQGYKVEPGKNSTAYQIADLGFQLSQDNLVLFMPDVQYIITIFAAAYKPRAAVALSKAYVHYCFYDRASIKKLFEVVREGLTNNDHDKIRPFLILFQHMIETAQAGQPIFQQVILGKYLEIFFTLMTYERKYFQYMEVVIDWVIKVAFRVPLMCDWMHKNPLVWNFLIDWLKENPLPPMEQYQDRRSAVILNKHDPNISRRAQDAKTSMYRFGNKRNQALCFYRKNSLIQIKQGQAPDLSNEIDLDYFHLDDIKLWPEQRVQIVECRHMYQVTQATVFTTMDELVYIRFNRVNSDDKWEATDRGRILIEGVWETSHMCLELTRLEEYFRRQEAQQVRNQKPTVAQHDDEMSDGNNTDEAQADIQPAYYQGDSEPQNSVAGANVQEPNEDMIDQTEQDEFLA